jgi:hypothetical protein
MPGSYRLVLPGFLAVAFLADFFLPDPVALVVFALVTFGLATVFLPPKIDSHPLPNFFVQPVFNTVISQFSHKTLLTTGY